VIQPGYHVLTDLTLGFTAALHFQLCWCREVIITSSFGRRHLLVKLKIFSMASTAVEAQAPSARLYAGTPLPLKVLPCCLWNKYCKLRNNKTQFARDLYSSPQNLESLLIFRNCPLLSKHLQTSCKALCSVPQGSHCSSVLHMHFPFLGPGTHEVCSYLQVCSFSAFPCSKDGQCRIRFEACFACVSAALCLASRAIHGVGKRSVCCIWQSAMAPLLPC